MKVEGLTKAAYIEFIKNTLATDGIKVADNANKIALENKWIKLDWYRAAARIIVDAYLAS